jgi:hypothetical protein
VALVVTFVVTLVVTFVADLVAVLEELAFAAFAAADLLGGVLAMRFSSIVATNLQF